MKEKLKCEDCGTTENVKKTNCPYQEDVNNEIVKAVLCDTCRTERLYDI